MEIAKIEPAFMVLAYLGMVIFTLMKIEEDRKRGLLESWTLWKKWLTTNIISILISAIIIPVCLYMCTDPLVKAYFPITTPTSVILGYGAQGIFRSIINISTPAKLKQTLPADGQGS